MRSLSFYGLEVDILRRQAAFKLAIVLEQIILSAARDPQKPDIGRSLPIEVGRVSAGSSSNAAFIAAIQANRSR
jgi:hypothetical protein